MSPEFASHCTWLAQFSNTEDRFTFAIADCAAALALILPTLARRGYWVSVEKEPDGDESKMTFRVVITGPTKAAT